MKACPGLRSGIDRSGSLSFAIRGIPSSIRPPIRHSGEGRNPGGVGRGKTTGRWKKPTHRPTFILLFGLRKAIGDSGDQKHAPYPDTGPQSRGVGRGGCSAGACPQLGEGRGAQTTPDPFFIPWCAGPCRHKRLARKHVPDSDPGCALQSTLMTALHGRNVPTCRPMAE